MDSSRNVLGVCCVDLETILDGDGGPLRQDDVFTVSLTQIFFVLYLHIQLSTTIDIKPTKVPTVFKRQETLGPDVTEAEENSPPFVIINIQTDTAELDSDIKENNKVQTNVRNPVLSLPDFLADNPFISDTETNDPASVSLRSVRQSQSVRID